MINRRHRLAISQQTKLLGISRDCAYYQPRPINENDLALMRRIDQLHLEHHFMGARMLRGQLVREEKLLAALA
ncbi:putative transposase [Desulforhopalus singaporensis]|uniref:Putative transposase n=1 Tax=Desulforhopalus singaporensis TaxID=91360 RepID=A0A1H0UXJ7_9BACT|nr:putative transposase [Desulforhopalus singaporensis]